MPMTMPSSAENTHRNHARQPAQNAAATGTGRVCPVLADRLHLPLMAVGAPEFESAQLESHKSVANLHQLDHAVQVVAGQDETVPRANGASPTAKEHLKRGEGRFF